MAGVTLGFLKYVLGFDSIQFRKGMSDAERDLVSLQKSFEKKGRQFQQLGKGLTAFVTLPIAGIAAAGIKEAQETQQAMAQVEAALSSMGPVAGRTADQLKKTADALELRSTFEADEILKKVTANLLTFGNVSGQAFDRAQQAAVDLSVRLGQDLQSSVIQVGKALNDPIKGVTALQRVGIQFSTTQKETIKRLVETGQTAKAQGIILDELERQFKGAAAAAADTDPLNQANKAWKQMAETVGTALLPILPVFANAVKSVADAFGSLSPETQKWVIIAGGAAAALGPLVIGLGSLTTVLASSAPLVATIGRTFGLLGPAAAGAGTATAAAGTSLAALAPILGAVAAAALGVYVAYKNWDKIGPYIDGVVKRTTEGAAQLNGKLKSITDGADALDRRLGIPTKQEFIDSVVRDVTAAVAKIDAALAAIQNAANAFDQAAVRAFNNVLAGVRSMATGVANWLKTLQSPFDWVRQKAKDVGDAFLNLYDRVVGHSYIPDMVDGIAAEMARLDSVMVQPVTKTTSKAAEAFRALQERVASLLDRLFPEQAAQLQFNKDLADLQANAQEAGWSVDQLAAAVSRLRAEYTGFPENPLPSDSITNPSPVDTGIDWEAMGRFADQIGPKMGAIVDNTQRWRDILSDVGAHLAGMLGDWLSRFVEGTAKLKDLWKSLLAFGIQFLTSPNGLASFFQPAGARASGGPVSGGLPYLVGEKGPEIFMPAGSGRIISHADSRRMMGRAGGGDVYQTFNVQTPDADSFRRNQSQLARDARRGLRI